MKKTLELDFSNKASNVEIRQDRVIKIWGEGLGWTETEAKAVLEDHDHYIENLESVNVRTSNILSKEVVFTEDNEYVIREQESFCGRDVSGDLLNSYNANELRDLIRHDFSAIATLLLAIPPRDSEKFSAKQPLLSVPVDMKPQNVVIDRSTGSPIVIDTFGPKLWVRDTIKSLPTRVSGRGQILHDEIKVGDIRFSLGRLNGYFIALATRWFINRNQKASIEEIDAFRFDITKITRECIEKIVINNELFDQDYAKLIVSDAAEDELRSIQYGSYEGPRYVQALYEDEESS